LLPTHLLDVAKLDVHIYIGGQWGNEGDLGKDLLKVVATHNERTELPNMNLNTWCTGGGISHAADPGLSGLLYSLQGSLGSPQIPPRGAICFTT
jgi:hypothetical protein